MKEKVFLSKLKEYILSNDAQQIWNLLEKNKRLKISTKHILETLADTSLTNKKIADIYITGQGGSGISKPNLTTLTAYYLAMCGYDVVKTGSPKRTSASGSSDFVANMRKRYPMHWEKSGLKYYDISSCSPWLKYKLLLEQHESFKEFFDKYIINECMSKTKFIGVLGGEAEKSRNKKTILYPASKEYTFYTKFDNCSIDEILLGDVFVNGNLYIKGNEKSFPILSKADVDSINTRLFLGKDRQSYWYKALKLSVSVIIHIYSNGQVSLEDAEKSFMDAYLRSYTIEKW